MAKSVRFYPTAKWAEVSGEFTAKELRRIANAVESIELRKKVSLEINKKG